MALGLKKNQDKNLNHGGGGKSRGDETTSKANASYTPLLPLASQVAAKALGTTPSLQTAASKAIEANTPKTNTRISANPKPLIIEKPTSTPVATEDDFSTNNLGDLLYAYGGGATPSYAGGGTSAPKYAFSGAVSQGTPAQFQPSEKYLQAMAYTQDALDKLNGRTSYSEKLDSILGNISNRDPFAYDFNTDPLFQAQLQASMNSGQLAMQNTMGQASALTGGYGSSYAVSAGSQAYNQYIQDAYNNLPEYYNLALEAYEAEGNRLMNEYNAYASADETEYSRMVDDYQLNAQNADNIYGKEYDNFWQTQNFNENQRQYDNDMLYKYDALNEEARQYANDMAYKYANLNENARQYDSDMAYKYANLNEDARQYNANLAEEMRQFDYESQQQTIKDATAKEPSPTEMSKAMDAYTTGGDNGLDKYLATLSDNVDVDKILDYVYGFGEVNYSAREYENTSDKLGWKRDQVINNYDDSTMTLKELKQKLIAEGMSEADADAFVKKYK